MAFFYILVYIRNHFLTSPYLLFRMYWNEGHKKWYHFCVVPLSDMALPPFLCTLECWSVKDWRWCCRYHYHFAFCAVCGGYWMISQNLAGFHCHTTCRTHLKKIKIITQVKIPFQRACTYVGFPFQCTEFMNVLTINCPFKENQPQNLLLSRHIILPFLPLHIIMKWLTLRMRYN